MICSLADVQALVDDGVQESRTLEYKETLPGSSDDAKREFLYDVSAMANCVGGTMIIGVAQKDGRPVSVCGCETGNIDDEIQRLENLLRNGLAPRLFGHTITSLAIAEGRYVLVLRIPRSLNAPHMVTHGGVSRFYIRNSNGKHLMDVGELRMAFLGSTNFIESARRWRDERIEAIVADNSVLRVGKYPALVLHLIRLGFAAEGTLIDVRDLNRMAGDLAPMSGTYFSRYNLDGLLLVGPMREDGTAKAYVQAFRTGQIEAYEAARFFRQTDGNSCVTSYSLEEAVIHYSNKYLRVLDAVGITPPIAVSLSLLNADGWQMATPPHLVPEDITPLFDRPRIVLPEVLLHGYNCDVAREFRPLFDALWNAGGFPGSPNYDENGNWARRA